MQSERRSVTLGLGLEWGRAQPRHILGAHGFFHCAQAELPIHILYAVHTALRGRLAFAAVRSLVYGGLGAGHGGADWIHCAAAMCAEPLAAQELGAAGRPTESLVSEDRLAETEAPGEV